MRYEVRIGRRNIRVLSHAAAPRAHSGCQFRLFDLLSSLMSTAIPEFKAGDLPADAKVAVVAARFNAHITDELLDGCLARLREMGLDEQRVESYRVPGAFELPVAAKGLARTRRFAAVICIGCVVRGDTPHFEYVAGEAARGIGQVALDECLPVIFGVLTTNTDQQARDRAGGVHSHAGRNAAEAAVEMISMLARCGKAKRRSPRSQQHFDRPSLHSGAAAVAQHDPCYNAGMSVSLTTLENQPLDPNTEAFLEEAHASKFDFHSASASKPPATKSSSARSTTPFCGSILPGSFECWNCPIRTSCGSLAGEIKQHTLDNLDYYLDQLKANVEKNRGPRSLRHATRTKRKQIILDIAQLVRRDAGHQEQVDGQRGDQPRPRPGAGRAGCRGDRPGRVHRADQA